MPRPLDAFDLPDPLRCVCGAVEPQLGEWPVCLSCDDVCCPDHFNGFDCTECAGDADYEPPAETGQESTNQRDVRLLQESGGQRR